MNDSKVFFLLSRVFRFSDENLFKILNAIIREFIIFVNELNSDTFDLFQRFLKIYLSKLDHWDKIWSADRQGGMITNHRELLKNFAILSTSRMTNGVTRAMEITVKLSMITNLNFQQALWKSSMLEAYKKTQANLTHYETMKNLFFFLRYYGSKDEIFPALMNRIIYKDIKLGGNNDGIQDILKYVRNTLSYFIKEILSGFNSSTTEYLTQMFCVVKNDLTM